MQKSYTPELGITNGMTHDSSGDCDSRIIRSFPRPFGWWWSINNNDGPTYSRLRTLRFIYSYVHSSLHTIFHYLYAFIQLLVVCHARNLITLRPYSNCDSNTIRVRFEHDSITRRTRCLRFEYDATSYEEPTRSYAHSSENEHVNSFALLYGVVANQRVGGGASAMT